MRTSSAPLVVAALVALVGYGFALPTFTFDINRFFNPNPAPTPSKTPVFNPPVNAYRSSFVPQAQPPAVPTRSGYAPVQAAPPPPPPSVDCVLGYWSAWSTCSADCDGGKQSRSRQILKEARGYGAPCGPRQEFQPCNTQPCQRDCVMGDWSGWSYCDAECGPGQRFRQRRITEKPLNGGLPCGPTTESEPCFKRPCQQDCVMGDWSTWSVCSASCDDGQRGRTRPVITEALNGGIPCGPREELEPCSLRPCPIDCRLAPWSAWTECSASCDEGRRARTRGLIQSPAFGGLPCGPREEWEICSNGPCPLDCSYGDWAPWSPCPPCGQASRFRARSITQQDANGGIPCDFGSLQESESCLNSPCPVDCVQAQWSSWTPCSASCGLGSTSRTRQTLTQAAFGGRPCGPAEDWASCQAGPCPSNCVQSEWSNWSHCSAPCGPGSRSRTRTVLSPASNGGLPCGPAEDWAPCSKGPCKPPPPPANPPTQSYFSFFG